MSDEQEGGGGEQVPAFDPNEIELPPDAANFVAKMRAGKKLLMRSKAYGEQTGQLRAFLGMHVFPYMEEAFVLLTAAYLDVYTIAASTAQDVQKLRRRVRDLEDDDRGSGDGPDDDEWDDLKKLNDDMLQALVGLAQVLEKKLPEEPTAHAAFDKCVSIATATQKFIDGDEEPGGDDEDEPEKPAKPEAAKPEAPPSPAPEEKP